MFTVPEEELLTMDIGPNMTYFLVEDDNGGYRVEDLTNVEPEQMYISSDVTYYYYSQRFPNGVKVTTDDISPLLNTDYDGSRPTYFLIHGWKNSYTSDINTLIKKAILDRNNINIFVVDWSPIASRNYFSARYAVGDVGTYVAEFINTLVANGLKLSGVSIAGHSLGAHVTGSCGAVLKGQLNYIVGLDPALPLFSLTDIDGRLDKTDAKFVQVIHSCGGRLGFFAPIGHSDYYPNGGASQTGCGFDPIGTCAHSRAYIYFAESISLPNAKTFVSKQCSSYKDYTSGRCNNNPRSNLGGYQLDTGAQGLYYLDTNQATPFAQG
ncbi:hypothetical protein NQ317_016756 [Molorchus minor]|uniref:Lipase domain-containing protein n=1 Tax=Molorchus minor TaxID=1323400 RepID=A0ABQ9JMA2_9CUCU|nr:hypothetical protein NQ317_016756 [Molorchus minor]